MSSSPLNRFNEIRNESKRKTTIYVVIFHHTFSTTSTAWRISEHSSHAENSEFLSYLPA